jgi:hypothetical protein
VALPLHRIYFDKALTFHSPDPTDPSVTERVITIMLAEAFARAGAIDAPPVSAGSTHQQQIDNDLSFS